MRHLCLLFALSFLVFPAAAAPAAAELTADEIIARHAEALGGLKAWSEVRSLRVEGRFTAFSESAHFVDLHARPDLYLRRTHVLGAPLAVGHDGDGIWMEAGITGAPWAVRPGPADQRTWRDRADLGSPLLAYSEKGHEVVLEGREDFEGELSYRLRLVRDDGREQTHIISADSFLEVARISPGSDFGTPLEQVTFFYDYRPVDGLQVPFRIEEEFGTRLWTREIASVTVNPEADPAGFLMPLSKGMERLRPLTGDWTVTAQVRPQPGADFREIPSTSSIEALYSGALLEEETLRAGAGGAIPIQRRWTFDRQDEVYRLTGFDSFNSKLTVLEGAFAESGPIHLVAADAEGAPRERWTLDEITDDGFTLERQTSADGESWEAQERYLYRRPEADSEDS